MTDELGAWFGADPASTGRQLLERLQETYPGRYPNGLVRTVQRRLKVWRGEMAHALVFGRAGGQSFKRIAGARRTGLAVAPPLAAHFDVDRPHLDGGEYDAMLRSAGRIWSLRDMLGVTASYYLFGRLIIGDAPGRYRAGIGRHRRPIGAARGSIGPDWARARVLRLRARVSVQITRPRAIAEGQSS